jgi:hypothetical protein
MKRVGPISLMPLDLHSSFTASRASPRIFTMGLGFDKMVVAINEPLVCRRWLEALQLIPTAVGGPRLLVRC